MSDKAEQLYKKANLKINQWFFNDYEQAYELFTQAAATFKSTEHFARAGEAYSRAGDCAIKNNDSNDARRAYSDSANAYSKVSMAHARTAFNMAIELSIENNQLASAARLERDFASALENSGLDEEAAMHYEKAARYYFVENQQTTSLQCKISAAKSYSLIGEFDKASSIFEEVGKKYSAGPLKFNAKDMFFKAILCKSATISEVNRLEMSSILNDTLISYYSLCHNFENSREAEILETLIVALEDNNIESFEKSLKMLHDYQLLDDWKINILHIIKESFEDLK